MDTFLTHFFNPFYVILKKMWKLRFDWSGYLLAIQISIWKKILKINILNISVLFSHDKNGIQIVFLFFILKLNNEIPMVYLTANPYSDFYFVVLHWISTKLDGILFFYFKIKNEITNLYFLANRHSSVYFACLNEKTRIPSIFPFWFSK